MPDMPMSADDLRELRTRIRFTQRELAQAIGVTRDRYAQWEAKEGGPPEQFIEAIQAVASRYPTPDDALIVRATPNQIRLTLAILRDCTQPSELRETAYQEMLRVLGLA